MHVPFAKYVVLSLEEYRFWIDYLSMVHYDLLAPLLRYDISNGLSKELDCCTQSQMDMSI